MTHPVPPRYFWLWHLAALKVIDLELATASAAPSDLSLSSLRPSAGARVTRTLWDELDVGPDREAMVALIDTGVSRRHPNLASRIDTDRSIDLTTHRYGAQHIGPAPDTLPSEREAKKAFFTGLDISALTVAGLTLHETDFLAALVADYAGSQGVVRRLAEPEELFAVHGTACAGLIVGEPAVVAAPGTTVAEPPEAVLSGGAINPNQNLLPYFGVDPFSRLLSIRTSFEEDPYQYIAALLYAWHCRVDAIVMPRGFPDPVRSRLSPKESLKANLEIWANRRTADLFHRLQQAPAETDAGASQPGFLTDRPWKILRQLLLAISQHIPVFCAAGNDGESQLIYPANLAEKSNGIIAVGAVTAEGFRSGYSNYGDGLTLVMPSSDFEILNRHQTRLDRNDPLLAMHDFNLGSGVDIVHCPLELVTTDLPGVFGYDGGAPPWSSVLPGEGDAAAGGGYYTAFGGTSGAACLAGGLAALAQRARRGAGKVPFTGPQMKAALVAASSTGAVVTPGNRILTPDPINTDDEIFMESAHFFGAGLPDARRLVARARSEA